MKPLFDLLHEKFITEALSKVNFKIDKLQELERNYLELKRVAKEKKSNSDKAKKLTDKNTDKIPKLERELREFIVEQFNKLGEEWKIKYKDTKLDDGGYKILTNAKILQVLADIYPEKGEFIKRFEGFFTYFSGFNQNRENYYTIEDKATGVANRIINENFVLFLEDKQSYQQILEKIPVLIKYKKYFELENYKTCLTQEGIENLNEKIIGKINQEKNLFLQQENTKSENKGKNLYLPNLKKLYKQIGCRSKQQREQEISGESIYPKYLEKIGLGFQLTKDNEEKYQIWECLNYINKKFSSDINKLKENYQNFFNKFHEYKLDEVWFRKESINTISGKWFGGENWYILADALKKTGTGKMEKGEYKIPAFVSLSELKNALDNLNSSYYPENLFKEEYKKFYKNSLFETFMAVWQHEIYSRFDNIYQSNMNLQQIFFD